MSMSDEKPLSNTDNSKDMDESKDNGLAEDDSKDENVRIAEQIENLKAKISSFDEGHTIRYCFDSIR